jgi:hypothetical protein
MALNDTAKNLMLDELASVAVYVSAHSADPGATGTNEISGGSPAYARKSITWNAASGGAIDSSNQPVLDIESGDTVSYLGLFSAATSGTFYGSANVTDEGFGAQGTYTVTDFDISIT